MKEAYRQQTINDAKLFAEMARKDAESAKSRKAKSEAWESYNFWMNKAAFLVNIGKQED